MLNHKEAFEHVHDNTESSSIYRVHDLLTSDHDIPALQDAPHVLAKADRRVVREYSESTDA